MKARSYSNLTIAEARRLLDNGTLTARELTEQCLAAITKHNRRLNACLAVCRSAALAAAAAADRRLQVGERAPLLGIPFLAKDNIMTKNVVTTAGSKMLKKYVAPYDATVIARLKEAGAILLGKTNLDEFAHGSSTEHSAFGPTKNPYDLTRVPGGSSGGSAAAVAAGMCLFALGTDTGGSVRQPAAFCGVIGYKPTYGLCSRFGLIAMTSSTDVPGVLARTVEDAAAVLAAMAGADERDAVTAGLAPYKPAAASWHWKGKTVGVVKEFRAANRAVTTAFNRTVAVLRTAGANVVSVSLPSTHYALAAYYIITPSEVSSNLARFDGLRYGMPPRAADTLDLYYALAREKGFGPEVKRRIMLGTFALSAGYYDAYYRQAVAAKQAIMGDFKRVFQKCDILVTPTTPTPAFKLGSKTKPLAMYREDSFVIPASLAGLPAVSVPAALKPLPVGVQLIGPRSGDRTVLAAAGALEKLLSLPPRKPFN